MPKKDLNKLQIRAEVLSAISNLQTINTADEYNITEVIDELKSIRDRACVSQILLKEFVKIRDSSKITIITVLILNIVPKDVAEQYFWSVLGNSEISDAQKYNIIELLKGLGSNINYEDYQKYFKNPDLMIDMETQNLLDSATINPEAQIDFLDFMCALPSSDRLILLETLSNDFQGDSLANVLIPLVYSNISPDLTKIAIEKIGDSKSSLGFEALEWAIQNLQDASMISLAKKNMSKLKLAGCSIKNADKMYTQSLIGHKINKCYISLPDGHGNQGIIVSSIKPDKKLRMFATVINSNVGIVDCFGFNSLSEEDFNRIVTRFYSMDRKIEISERFIKNLLIRAENITRDTKLTISYEYICWRILLRDVKPVSDDILEYLKKHTHPIKPAKSNLDLLYGTNYADKWFFDLGYNDEFDVLLVSIINQIKREGDFLIESAEDVIECRFEDIFSLKMIEEIDFRLLMSAFLANQLSDKLNSAILASLVKDSEVKKLFLTNILKKSVYEFFLREKERLTVENQNTTIFTQKKEKSDFSLEMLDKILLSIEDGWCQ